MLDSWDVADRQGMYGMASFNVIGHITTILLALCADVLGS